MNELGYWVHKDTGVKTTFELDADFIVNNVFGIPSWKMDASEIYVPEGITAIGAASLSGATNLVTLNLPSTLTEIRTAAFNGCTGLINFYIKAIIPPSFVMPGGYVGDFSTQVKVPEASYDAYRVAPTWSLFINHIFVLNDLIPGSRVHEDYVHQPTSITIIDQEDIIIENLIFDGSTQVADSNYGCITTWRGQNIIIRNCKFINVKVSQCISINESTNVSIYNCDIVNCWSGIKLWNCEGFIRIFSNDFHNIKGSLVSDIGREGGAIHYQGCSGPGNIVQDNALEQDRGAGSTIDHIAFFRTHCDVEAPLIVRNNWIRGGGPHRSGGGILLGDYGGENLIMEDNVLVDPGQYGIGIAGGANMVMRRNKVYGSQRPWSNVGIVVIDWTPQELPSGNYTVENNKINWKGDQGLPTDYWVYEAQQWPIGWETNMFQDQSVTPDMLPPQIIGVYPQVPDAHRCSGYWIHKDTKQKTIFGLDALWINGTVFNPMGLGDIVSEVFIPEGITEISNVAFNDLTYLETIILPSTLKTIGDYVFAGCVGLVNLNLKAVIPPVIGELGINIGSFRTQVKVPEMSYDRYRTSSSWFPFKDLIFILNKLYPGSRFHNGYVSASQPTSQVGTSNIIIENMIFDGDMIGNSIAIALYNGNNVTIRNCKFINFPTKRAIHLEGCSNVSVYNCDFIRVQCGIRVTTCTNNIRIFSCDFKNILGDMYTTSYGQAIQFIGCAGTNFRVQDIANDNILGKSQPEDLISVFNCHFENSSPMLIRNNWLRGGGGAGDGDGATGAGIQIGDYSGTNITAEDNICVRTGGCGISISGGDKMTLQRNISYIPQTQFSEIGMVVANWTPEIQMSEIITVRENRVLGVKRDGTINNWWYMDPNFPVIGKETNIVDNTLSDAVLPPQIVGEYLPGTSPRPEIGVGYWIHQATEVKIEFDGDAVFIQGSAFGNPQPAWKAYSSEVKIPEGIVSTAGNALLASPNMTKLYLPSTLEQLGTNSLSECPNLEELHIAAITPPTYPQMDGGIGGTNLKIYVPAESVNTYKQAPGWSSYSDKIFSEE